MLGQLLKYLLLGILFGSGDHFVAEWFRTGRERRKQKRYLRGLRHLRDHYQPNTFEADCEKPEFRASLLQAREYYREGDRQSEKRLEELMAKAEGTAIQPQGVRTRAMEWLKRDRIEPMPLRKKGVFALVIALLIDLWTMIGWGFSEGLGALAWSLLEAPAMLLGLMAAPYVSRAVSLATAAAGAGGELQSELRAVAEDIERNKRSLDLRLKSPTLLPGESPGKRSALPPRS